MSKISEIVLNFIFFLLIYWLFINFAFVIYFFKRKKTDLAKNIPSYQERFKKVKNLIKKEGYQLSTGFKFWPFGRIAFGAAIPFSKKVFITPKLLKKLTYQELIYVVHHEIGHYELKHPFKLTVLGIFLAFFYLVVMLASKQTGFLLTFFAAIAFAHLGLFFARKAEDEADEYTLKKIGFEKAKRGLLALQKLNGTKYDRKLLESFFNVHRTHLAVIDRLKSLSSENVNEKE